MLKLNSHSLYPLGEALEDKASIRRIAENSTLKSSGDEYLLVRDQQSEIVNGFGGYLFFEKPEGKVPRNSFLLEPALSYLCSGDIVKINPRQNSLTTLYRRNSPHNTLLLTEKCNNLCLMCSQPPRRGDDSFLIEDALQAIPLMAPETASLGLSGGEPTLLGFKLIEIVRHIKDYLPQTAVHILSNGRQFHNWNYAKALSDIGHPDLMVGVPLYSDLSSAHNYIVQAPGAFDETIRGIINLKSVNQKVEIRVVLHKLTFGRLPELARFIRRNLTFCDHVALMGMELTGFARPNLDMLWIDPKEYQEKLREAVLILEQGRIPVSVYNQQLCLLDRVLVPFYRKSISDWKNEYMPECGNCAAEKDCGGFFSSDRIRYSDFISPFRQPVNLDVDCLRQGQTNS